jgi:hypothetical protein
MKNVIGIAKPREIEEYVEAHLRTDEFRRSLEDRGGYIRHWVSRFAQVPRVFFDMSHPYTEHPHFYPWMGCFMTREYENGAVNDLFWLHEIAHAVMLEYDEHTTHQAWLDKMVQNELRTALESECMVYWEIPGIRRKTFPFEIWADSFLDRPMRTRENMYAERKRAMHAPVDSVEQEMSCYPRQNSEWGEVWKHSWQQPEKAMRKIREAAANEEREQGLAEHLRWLKEETGMSDERPYPFPEEAEHFAGIYWRNKNAGLTRTTGNSSDSRRSRINEAGIGQQIPEKEANLQGALT